MRAIDLMGGLMLVVSACSIGFENALYFVTNTAKDR